MDRAFRRASARRDVAARVPFIGLFFATGWIYYRLASGLFGPRAALIALFALNATPFFFASAGSWIVPDGPLLFGLAIVAWRRGGCSFGALPMRPWLGDLAPCRIGFRLAGLAKYSATLTAGGLAAFIGFSPEKRCWIKHPAPYVSAIVALAMITPVVLWNARHRWASFEFQGGRGVPTANCALLRL